MSATESDAVIKARKEYEAAIADVQWCRKELERAEATMQRANEHYQDARAKEKYGKGKP